MRVIIQCCLLFTWLHTLNSVNAADMEPFLIFVNGKSLKKMNLDGSNVSTLKQELMFPVALDFDYRQQMIYWTDTGTDMISRMHINGSGTQVLHSQSIERPFGLAVDWVGGNLYWSDYGRDTIEVSKLTGEHRAVLVNTGLDLPYALAVDVRYGRQHIGGVPTQLCCKPSPDLQQWGWRVTAGTPNKHLLNQNNNKICLQLVTVTTTHTEIWFN